MIKKSVFVYFILVISLFISCCTDDKYYNWAMKNNGETVCGVEGIAGIDIDIDNKSYDWENKPLLIAVVDSEISNLKNEAIKDIIVNENDVFTAGKSHANPVVSIISTPSNCDYKSVLKNAPIYSIVIDIQNINVSKLIEDLEFAEKIGIKVVNMSFTMDYFCEELYDFMSNSSMLFVCAVGNEHKNHIAYPANFNLENIISVIGINNYGYCSRYSNYSIAADIAAPGENVLCITEGNNYEYLSGTSYAAPFVTACSAFLLSEIECEASYAKKIVVSCATKNEFLINYVNEGKVLSMNNIISYIDEHNSD